MGSRGEDKILLVSLFITIRYKRNSGWGERQERRDNNLSSNTASSNKSVVIGEYVYEFIVIAMKVY